MSIIIHVKTRKCEGGSPVAVEIVRDKTRLYEYLIQDRYLHLYEIGDLDEFFFPDTRWYTLSEKDDIKAIALLYNGLSIPTLIALTDAYNPMVKLLHHIIPELPSPLYVHLSPGLENPFRPYFDIESVGENFKMGLTGPETVREIDTEDVVGLNLRHSENLVRFYREAYPGNWFSPRMLESGHYYGLFDGDAIIAAAGVHVYSVEYNVAALGNIAVHPEYRNRGLGGQVTAACCKALLNEVELIGLNVAAGNRSAIALYKRLGFQPAARYFEYRMDKPTQNGKRDS